MGGAASSNRAEGELYWATIKALPPPIERGDTKLVYVLPQDEPMKQRSPTMLLEVGPLGFRLLRPETEDPLYCFLWGQIHSWSQSNGKFTFRVFDERNKVILQYNLHVRDMPALLDHIQHVIETILDERKSQAITEADFENLLQTLETIQANMRLQRIQTAVKMNYFTATQGTLLVKALANSFDKVEAATLLHSKLVDQNHFNLILEALDCQDDRENVWHRISELKKKNASLTRSSSAALQPAPE